MKTKSDLKTPVDWKYYISIGGKLLIIAALTAALLAFINMLTYDRISENESKVINNAISSIFSSPDKIKKSEKQYDSPVVAVYKVYNDGDLKGYCIQVEPMGFKDKITMLVGADIYGNCVGVEITALSDTPGVGTKAKDRGYLDGLKGYDVKNISDYDTITGATISSTAVKDGVRAALSLDIYKEKKADKIPDDIPEPDDDNNNDETSYVQSTEAPGEVTETKKFERFETLLDRQPVRRPWMTEAPESTAAPETTVKPDTDKPAPDDSGTASSGSETKPLPPSDTSAESSDKSTSDGQTASPETTGEAENDKNAAAPSDFA